MRSSNILKFQIATDLILVFLYDLSIQRYETCQVYTFTSAPGNVPDCSQQLAVPNTMRPWPIMDADFGVNDLRTTGVNCSRGVFSANVFKLPLQQTDASRVLPGLGKVNLNWNACGWEPINSISSNVEIWFLIFSTLVRTSCPESMLAFR